MVSSDPKTGLDSLSDVELQSFTADPTTILPFGASLLSWLVTGPRGAFQVYLDKQPVRSDGDLAVQPESTTTYTLSAASGQFRRTLARVSVTVVSDQCQVCPIVNPRSAIQAPVRASILANGKLYFQNNSGPVVTFSTGSIRVQMQLGYNVPYFPDPEIDIDSSFGLAVQNGQLVGINQQVSVDVSVPWWAWGIPGAIPGLAIALDGAKSKAYNEMQNGIAGIVELLNFYLTPPQGFRNLSVRVDDGDNGAGIIETTQCPDNIVRQTAAISNLLFDATLHENAEKVAEHKR